MVCLFISPSIRTDSALGNHDVAPHLNANYYWFRQADAAFFVWDTRAFRSPNKAKDDEDKTMLGDTQKQVFRDWLASVSPSQSEVDKADQVGR